MSVLVQQLMPLVQPSRSLMVGGATRHRHQPGFGIMFDIDGVIVRGRTVLPNAPEAFRKLVEPGTLKFKVPTIFVTNAGNSLRQEKADKLSAWLDIPISEDQVVMAHSPLRMFNEFHNKHVLVTGQGPVELIARNLGFKKITTIDQLRVAFPVLDAVDHKRRAVNACPNEKNFPRIEAVVLFGEPVRWETSLQLLLDVLLTNGQPSAAPESIHHPHLPILACNMDLQWMAEAVMPRFGHGAFLLCLENLYKKVTGKDLVYSALIGKPSEITYRHSEHVLQEQAVKLGHTEPVNNIYCIGDNICTDIFGANLYNRYLSDREKDAALLSQANSQNLGQNSRSIDNLIGAVGELNGASSCLSILVETGVYSRAGGCPVSLDHSPRDFLPVESSYQEPTFCTPDVLKAVDLIFERENYSA